MEPSIHGGEVDHGGISRKFQNLALDERSDMGAKHAVIAVSPLFLLFNEDNRKFAGALGSSCSVLRVIRGET